MGSNYSVSTQSLSLEKWKSCRDRGETVAQQCEYPQCQWTIQLNMIKIKNLC